MQGTGAIWAEQHCCLLQVESRVDCGRAVDGSQAGLRVGDFMKKAVLQERQPHDSLWQGAGAAGCRAGTCTSATEAAAGAKCRTLGSQPSQCKMKWQFQQLTVAPLTRLPRDVGWCNVLAAEHAVVQPQQTVPAQREARGWRVRVRVCGGTHPVPAPALRAVHGLREFPRTAHLYCPL